MSAGRLLRELQRDSGPCLARDRGEVLEEMIAQCGDEPALAEARRILEGFRRPPTEVKP